MNELTHWTRRCSLWVERTYGLASLLNIENRAMRVAEEAVELAQADGVTREQMLKIVERCFSRPPGDPRQEVAGTLFTLLVYAEVKGIEPITELAREVLRVEDTDPEVYRAKQREKFAAGTDLVPLP